MRKWSFYDPVLDSTYYWEVNPNTDNGSHGVDKATSYEVAAGLYQDNSGYDNIANIIHKSNTVLSSFSYSGFTYTRQQLEDLELWCNKPYDIILNDDLERSFRIYIDGFATKRVRSRMFPYKHSYTFTGRVLEEIIV